MIWALFLLLEKLVVAVQSDDTYDLRPPDIDHDYRFGWDLGADQPQLHYVPVYMPPAFLRSNQEYPSQRGMPGGGVSPPSQDRPERKEWLGIPFLPGPEALMAASGAAVMQKAIAASVPYVPTLMGSLFDLNRIFGFRNRRLPFMRSRSEKETNVVRVPIRITPNIPISSKYIDSGEVRMSARSENLSEPVKFVNSDFVGIPSPLTHWRNSELLADERSAFDEGPTGELKPENDQKPSSSKLIIITEDPEAEVGDPEEAPKKEERKMRKMRRRPPPQSALGSQGVENADQALHHNQEHFRVVGQEMNVDHPFRGGQERNVDHPFRGGQERNVDHPFRGGQEMSHHQHVQPPSQEPPRMPQHVSQHLMSMMHPMSPMQNGNLGMHFSVPEDGIALSNNLAGVALNPLDPHPYTVAPFAQPAVQWLQQHHHGPAQFAANQTWPMFPTPIMPDLGPFPHLGNLQGFSTALPPNYLGNYPGHVGAMHPGFFPQLQQPLNPQVLLQPAATSPPGALGAQLAGNHLTQEQDFKPFKPSQPIDDDWIPETVKMMASPDQHESPDHRGSRELGARDNPKTERSSKENKSQVQDSEVRDSKEKAAPDGGNEEESEEGQNKSPELLTDEVMLGSGHSDQEESGERYRRPRGRRPSRERWLRYLRWRSKLRPYLERELSKSGEAVNRPEEEGPSPINHLDNVEGESQRLVKDFPYRYLDSSMRAAPLAPTPLKLTQQLGSPPTVKSTKGLAYYVTPSKIPPGSKTSRPVKYVLVPAGGSRHPKTYPSKVVILSTPPPGTGGSPGSKGLRGNTGSYRSPEKYVVNLDGKLKTPTGVQFLQPAGFKQPEKTVEYLREHGRDAQNLSPGYKVHENHAPQTQTIYYNQDHQHLGGVGGESEGDHQQYVKQVVTFNQNPRPVKENLPERRPVSGRRPGTGQTLKHIQTPSNHQDDERGPPGHFNHAPQYTSDWTPQSPQGRPGQPPQPGSQNRPLQPYHGSFNKFSPFSQDRPNKPLHPSQQEIFNDLQQNLRQQMNSNLNSINHQGYKPQQSFTNALPIQFNSIYDPPKVMIQDDKMTGIVNMGGAVKAVKLMKEVDPFNYMAMIKGEDTGPQYPLRNFEMKDILSQYETMGRPQNFVMDSVKKGKPFKLWKIRMG